MRDTDIAKVEGRWLLSNWPNHSVLKTQTTAPRLVLTSLYSSLPNSMRDACDIIKRCHNHLLYFFSGKTTAHAQRKHLIHLCICLHQCPSLQLLPLHMNPLSFPYPQFHACDTYTRVRLNKLPLWSQRPHMVSCLLTYKCIVTLENPKVTYISKSNHGNFSLLANIVAQAWDLDLEIKHTHNFAAKWLKKFSTLFALKLKKRTYFQAHTFWSFALSYCANTTW